MWHSHPWLWQEKTPARAQAPHDFHKHGDNCAFTCSKRTILELRFPQNVTTFRHFHHRVSGPLRQTAAGPALCYNRLFRQQLTLVNLPNRQHFNKNKKVDHFVPGTPAATYPACSRSSETAV